MVLLSSSAELTDIQVTKALPFHQGNAFDSAYFCPRESFNLAPDTYRQAGVLPQKPQLEGEQLERTTQKW